MDSCFAELKAKNLKLKAKYRRLVVLCLIVLRLLLTSHVSCLTSNRVMATPLRPPVSNKPVIVNCLLLIVNCSFTSSLLRRLRPSFWRRRLPSHGGCAAQAVVSLGRHTHSYRIQCSPEHAIFQQVRTSDVRSGRLGCRASMSSDRRRCNDRSAGMRSACIAPLRHGSSA